MWTPDCLILSFKLLAKNPDARYQSAHGLKADLLQCQRRLLTAVTTATDQSMDVSDYVLWDTRRV